MHHFLARSLRESRLLPLLAAAAAVLLSPTAARAQSYSLKTLYTFDGTRYEFPTSLVRDGQGNLIGIALKGGPTGSDNNGVIYKLTPAGNISTLAAFDGLDGDKPTGSLLIDGSGNLWGATTQGGVGWDPQRNFFGWGTLFRISSSGVFTPGFVEFNGPHGATPVGDLVQDLFGNILGATFQGGAPWNPALGDFASGTVFQLSTSGVLSDRLLLDGGNGSTPNAGPAVDQQGNVYGTTSDGGKHGFGTLYQISPSGELTVLFDFDGVHGKNPTAGVAIDSHGNLFGTTQQGGVTAINGGTNGFGTVWEYSASAGLRTLVSFNGANGMFPAFGVTLDGQGNLFGSTVNGGTTGDGVLFKYSPAGVLSTLVDFDGPKQGAFPESELAIDSAGTLYGSANGGGATGNGTLFAVQPVSTALGVTSVALSPASVTGGGTAQGSVTISGPAPAGGIVVTLGSNSSQATPQGPVTIPAGATSAAFSVSTFAVTDTTPVAISAALGSATQQVTLTVLPPATTALANIQISPDTIQGGTTATGTITLNRVGPAAVVVQLTSNSSLASVPSSVTVPAGALSANFSVVTQPVSSSTSVTITATLGTSSLQYFPLITPPLPFTIGHLSVNLSPVQGGTPLVGLVLISRPAPVGGINVALSSDNPAVVVPASVTVPEGVGIWSFPVRTNSVSASTTATITATLGSSTLQTTATVLPATTPAISGFAITPGSVTGGISTQGTVTLSTVAPAGGTIVHLSASNPAVGLPQSVAVSEGESTVTFAVTTPTVAATTNVVVTATAGASSGQAAFSITPAAPPVAVTGVTFNPSSVQGGASSTGTVTLSGLAPDGGTVVALSSSSAVAAVPASVTVAPNSNTATFPVTTQKVTASTTATVTATANGTSAAGALTITSAPSLGVSSVAVSPTTIRGGDRGTGTVTLTGPAPVGGAVVTLTSSNSSVASVPSSVTVAAGKTSATFTVNTGRPSVSTSVTISAKFNTVATTTITVTRH